MADQDEVFEGLVPEALHGRRLEEVLLALLEGRSRSAVARLIRRGAVTVDGVRVLRSGLRMQGGWFVRVGLKPSESLGRRRAPAARVELDVLFEDEHLAVVNKPAGLLCHGKAEPREATRDIVDEGPRGRGAGGRASLRGGAGAGGPGASRPGARDSVGERDGEGRADAGGWNTGQGGRDSGSRGRGGSGGRDSDAAGQGWQGERGSDVSGRSGQGGRGGSAGQGWQGGRDSGRAGASARKSGPPTLADLAVARFGRLPLLMGDERPGIVHRLDRETSGLIVVAKTGEAMEGLREAFRERRVEKAYLAVVLGTPEWDARVLDWDLVDGEGDRRGWREAGGAEDGRRRQTARTEVEVLERYGPAALVLCHPETGRRHQLRVHLFAAGFGVVGDKLYRDREQVGLPAGAPAVGRHLLHAAGLAFVHPVTGEGLEFEAPPADDMGQMIEWLSGE